MKIVKKEYLESLNADWLFVFFILFSIPKVIRKNNYLKIFHNSLTKIHFSDFHFTYSKKL